MGFLSFYKSSLYISSHHSFKVIKEGDKYKISLTFPVDIFKTVIAGLKKQKESIINAVKVKKEKEKKEQLKNKYQAWLKDISEFENYLESDKNIKVILSVDASHHKNWSVMALEQNFKKTGQVQIQIKNNGDWFAHLNYCRPKIEVKKLKSRELYVYVADGGILEADVCENGKLRNWKKTITFDSAIAWKRQFNRRSKIYDVNKVDREQEERAIIQMEKNDALRNSKRADFRQTDKKTCRKGHGLKRKFLATERLAIKDRNKKEYFNHTKSDYIIRNAVNSKCCKVKMVDLCGYKSETLVLGEWPYYDLMLKIEQKCGERGLKFEKVAVGEFEETFEKIVNNKV